MMSPEDVKILMQDYIDEMELALQAFSDYLLKLEKGTVEEAETHAILRQLHSMKGAAQIMDLEQSSNIYHQLESIMLLISTGQLKPECCVISNILEATDYLKQTAYSARTTGEILEEDPFHIFQMLNLFLEVQAEREEKADHPKASALKASEFEPLLPEDISPFDPRQFHSLEMLNSFTFNTRLILDELAAVFFQMEKDKQDLNLVDIAFRHLHTIKGNAMMLPIPVMGILTHRMEAMLDCVRKHIEKLDQEMMDLLIDGLDNLEMMLVSLEKGQIIHVDIQPFLERFQVLCEQHHAINTDESENEKDKPDMALEPQVIPANPPDEVQEVASIPAVQVKRSAQPEPKAKQPDSAEEKKVIRSLRVDIEKIDQNMNLLTELIINKIRFEEHFTSHLISQNTLLRMLKRLVDMNQLDMGLPRYDHMLEHTAQLFKNFRKTRDALALERELVQMLQNHAHQTRRLNLDQSLEQIKDLSMELKKHMSRNQEGLGLLSKSLKTISNITNDFQESLLKIRMIPVSNLYSRFPRMVRDLGHKLNKEIELRLFGESIEMDKTIVEEIGDSLMHIVRNSADHGLESAEERVAAGKSPVGTILLNAYYEGNQVVIEVTDDGRGMDVDLIRKKALEMGLFREDQDSGMTQSETLNLIFAPGFSTSANVTDVSGRGVGMDVVKTRIKQLKGTVELQTELGKGTTVRIRLPLTLRIIQTLLVRIGNETLAIPLPFVIKTMVLPFSEVRSTIQQKVINYYGRTVSIVPLSQILRITTQPIRKEAITLVIIQYENRIFALAIDSIEERKEVVIKNFGDYINYVKFASGATILGNGRVVVILDIPQLLNTFISTTHHGQIDALGLPGDDEKILLDLESDSKKLQEQKTILVVEDSGLIRKVLTKGFQLAGYNTLEAADGVDALQMARQHEIDLFTVDVRMPRMDGYELTARLRKIARYAKTPILIVSSNTAELDKQRGLEAGADEYFAKPFNQTDLVKAVMRRLK